MATPTRRIARCSTMFFRAASKAYMVTAWCGLVLMSAVAAYASLSLNGLTENSLTTNALTLNGMPMDELPLNGCPMDELFLHGTAAHGANYSSESSPRVPNEKLPWATLSHQGLGKSSH